MEVRIHMLHDFLKWGKWERKYPEDSPRIRGLTLWPSNMAGQIPHSVRGFFHLNAVHWGFSQPWSWWHGRTPGKTEERAARRISSAPGNRASCTCMPWDGRGRHILPDVQITNYESYYFLGGECIGCECVYICIIILIPCIPVVPHKAVAAVAEVSKIGNL